MKIKPSINIYTSPTTLLNLDNEYEVDNDLADFLYREGYCQIISDQEEPRQKKAKQLNEKSA